VTGGEIAAIALGIPLAVYLAHGEGMVARQKRESEQHLRSLVGQRVRLTLSGRVMWIVSGVVDTVDAKSVWLRNDAGAVDPLPLVMIREIERSSEPPDGSRQRVVLRKRPWWRYSKSTWPLPGMRPMERPHASLTPNAYPHITPAPRFGPVVQPEGEGHDPERPPRAER
jgi:hypothetical protein